MKPSVQLICYKSRFDKSESDRWHDPVGYQDTQTGKHDLRIALCLATGVPMEYIHPGTGHNMGAPVTYPKKEK